MADAKISALTALTGANTAVGDLLPIVDISDTTMAASGTTKKTTRADLQVYAGGTVTSSTPTLDLSQTWNAGAVTFTGIKQNITDTASAAASLLMDLQVASSSKFAVRKDGYISATGFANSGTTATYEVKFENLGGGANIGFYAAGTRVAYAGYSGFQSGSANPYTWNSSASAAQSGADTGLSRISAGVVGVGTGAAGSTAGTLQAAVLNGIGGTVTSSTPVVDITQTWNSGAVTFTAIKANITNTASAAASLLMDLQVGGTAMAKIRKDGLLTLGDASVNAGVVIGGQNTIYWSGAQIVYQQHLVAPSAGNYDIGAAGQEYRRVFQYSSSTRVGGTTLGGVTSADKVVKTITGIADAVATATFTVTIPNAAHSAGIRVKFTGSLGAGGAVGANEATGTVCYDIAIARTAGVNAVATISSAYGSGSASVAGGATITVTGAMSAVSGAVGATNTFTINVTITRGSGASTNHTCVAMGEIVNANASGVTLS